MIGSTEKAEERILSIIPRYKEDAITLTAISWLTGYSQRLIKKAISNLRRKYPICSKETGCGGYWIAENSLDIYEFISMIEKRKAGYQTTIDNMKNQLNSFYGKAEEI